MLRSLSIDVPGPGLPEIPEVVQSVGSAAGMEVRLLFDRAFGPSAALVFNGVILAASSAPSYT